MRKTMDAEAQRRREKQKGKMCLKNCVEKIIGH